MIFQSGLFSGVGHSVHKLKSIAEINNLMKMQFFLLWWYCLQHFFINILDLATIVWVTKCTYSCACFFNFWIILPVGGWQTSALDNLNKISVGDMSKNQELQTVYNFDKRIQLNKSSPTIINFTSANNWVGFSNDH